MAKIILNDGTEEFLSPVACRTKINAGEAKWPQEYLTREMVAGNNRQMTAEPPKQEEVKTKRKRRTKAEIEADKAAADEAE